MNRDTFLIPTYTDNQDELSIISYEKSNDFYLLSFIEAKKIKSDEITKIKYFVDPLKKFVDYVAEPHGTPIVSSRMLKIIQRFEKNIQVFEAPLYKKSTNEKISNYFIVNFLNLTNPINSELSKYSDLDGSLKDPVIIESKITSDIFAFRLKDMLYKIYFRRELALAIYSEKITGIEFLKTKSV